MSAEKHWPAVIIRKRRVPRPLLAKFRVAKAPGASRAPRPAAATR
ncbi:Hypothetical protein MIP_04721 [Mycobacterium intracellulare subsp. intracellulare MTCC 9506]|uniref:Uncharacterized protein n=1 Tax=Mycobacterium indicus pranii (strain DSM 45239 / MTCC 9506) TaxID=1232724 RepID=J9WIS0_MYCIP|nr:Hypothetical protein MIP_04721 [Mycobacterium intracellulare subsp. intracellulare MTCC 9506]